MGAIEIKKVHNAVIIENNVIQLDARLENTYPTCGIVFLWYAENYMVFP